MFCLNCGREAKEGQPFCGNCGSKLPVDSYPTSTASTAGSTPATATSPSATAQASTPVTPTSSSAYVPASDPVLTSVPRSGIPVSPSFSSQSQPQGFGTQSQAQGFGAQPQGFAPRIPAASAQQAVPTLQFANLTNEAKAIWSTPYAIVSLVGKLVAVIALLMPCISFGGLLECNMWSLNASVGSTVKSAQTVESYFGSGGGTGSSSLASYAILFTIATIVWALMIAAVVFTIVRPLVKNDKLAAIEQRGNIDTIILVVVGLLCLAWCGFVMFLDSTIKSMYFGLSVISVPLGPWIAAIASLLMAFWPRLSKYVGLSS